MVRTQQPAGITPLSRNTPLTKGLIFCAIPALGYDAVSMTAAIAHPWAPGKNWVSGAGPLGKTHERSTNDETTVQNYPNTVKANFDGGDFTVLTLMRIDVAQIATAIYAIMGKWDLYGSGTGQWAFYSTNGSLAMGDPVGGDKYIPLVTGVTPRKKALFAMTKKGTVLSGYEDGVKVGTAVAPAYATGNTSRVVLGCNHMDNPSEALQGGIYLSAIWNRALTDSEIAAVWANPWQIFRDSSVMPSARYLAGGAARIASIQQPLGVLTQSATFLNPLVGQINTTLGGVSDILAATIARQLSGDQQLGNISHNIAALTGPAAAVAQALGSVAQSIVGTQNIWLAQSLGELLNGVQVRVPNPIWIPQLLDGLSNKARVTGIDLARPGALNARVSAQVLTARINPRGIMQVPAINLARYAQLEQTLGRATCDVVVSKVGGVKITTTLGQLSQIANAAAARVVQTNQALGKLTQFIAATANQATANTVSVSNVVDAITSGAVIVDEGGTFTAKLNLSDASSLDSTCAFVIDASSTAVANTNYNPAIGYSFNGSVWQTMVSGGSITIPAGSTYVLISGYTLVSASPDNVTLKFKLLNFTGGISDPLNRAVCSVAINSTNIVAPPPVNPTPVAEYMLGPSHHMHKSVSAGNTAQVSALCAEAGFNTIRDDMEIGWIRPTISNTYNYSGDLAGKATVYANDPYFTQTGVTQSIILGYEHTHSWNQDTQNILINPTVANSVFDRYARTMEEYTDEMLSKFPKAKQFEVFNEWNWWFHLAGAKNTSPTLMASDIYARLFRRVAARVRQGRPGARVLLNGIADKPGGLPWGPDFDWMIRQANFIVALGGSLSEIGGFNVHTYFDGASQTKIAEILYYGLLCGHNWVMSEVPGAAAANILWYVTESGIPNNTDVGVYIDPQSQGNQLQRMALLYRTLPFMAGHYIYDLVEDTSGGPREQTFGMVNTNLTKKPAFNMLKAVTKLILLGKGWSLVHADTWVANPTTFANRVADQWTFKNPNTWYAVRCSDFTDPADGRRKSVTAVWGVQNNYTVNVSSSNSVLYQTDFGVGGQTKTGAWAFTATPKPAFLIQDFGQNLNLT